MSCPVNSRYSRTIALPEIGESGQRRISSGSVLIVGAGALGGTTAMYLAASGIGHIGIADFDTVDISNLQRQVAYVEADAGQPKTSILCKRLLAINSGIEVTEYPMMVSKHCVEDIISDFDFIIEGSDNPYTKLLISRTCKKLGKSYCLGGVAGFSGQIMTHTPATADYEDIFPEPPEPTGFTPCSAGGVFGPLTGIVASIQASEAIKYISGAGKLLTDCLLTIDSRDMTFRTFRM